MFGFIMWNISPDELFFPSLFQDCDSEFFGNAQTLGLGFD
nr:MAG TPA: hypothetical protein [Caudoviricetes sp.]